MKLNKSKLVISLLTAGVMSSPLAHATNGYFPIGVGPKTEAMGGAGIALPQDSFAAAANPAGMAMVGDRVDFALTWFKPNRSAEIAGSPNPAANGTFDGNGRSNFFIPDFGYNKMISNDTALGVVIYGNGGMNTQYNNSPLAAYGTSGNLGINLEQLFIAPTWSKKLNETNSIGVSLNLAYQMFSATGLGGTGPVGGPTGGFTGLSQTPSAMTDNGTDTSTGYGIRVGWTGEITPMVTLGATYQSKTKMSSFSKYSGLFADQGSFDVPANYGVGIAVKATPVTTFAFDVEQIDYSGISSVGNSFTVLPPPYGTGPQFGSSGGPGFGWQNMTIFKLGMSHAFSSTFTMRAGYNHNNQQIANDQTLLNILAPGVVQDHLSLGGTWTLADKSEITVAYIHAFSKTINGSTNTIPAAFGGGEANLTMHEDSIGISYGW